MAETLYIISREHHQNIVNQWNAYCPSDSISYDDFGEKYTFYIECLLSSDEESIIYIEDMLLFIVLWSYLRRPHDDFWWCDGLPQSFTAITELYKLCLRRVKKYIQLHPIKSAILFNKTMTTANLFDIKPFTAFEGVFKVSDLNEANAVLRTKYTVNSWFVPFERVCRLVGKRKVLLWDGFALLDENQYTEFICDNIELLWEYIYASRSFTDVSSNMVDANRFRLLYQTIVVAWESAVSKIYVAAKDGYVFDDDDIKFIISKSPPCIQALFKKQHWVYKERYAVISYLHKFGISKEGIINVMQENYKNDNDRKDPWHVVANNIKYILRRNLKPYSCAKMPLCPYNGNAKKCKDIEDLGEFFYNPYQYTEQRMSEMPTNIVKIHHTKKRKYDAICDNKFY